MSEKIVASWDRRARAYDALTRRWPIFRRMAARLVSELPPRFDGLAVDLAAGAGLVSGVLLKRRPRARVALVEPAPSMLRIARKRLKGTGAAFYSFTAEHAGRLPLRADAVLCSAAAHLMDEERLFAAVGRLLKPGGLFCFNLWGHSYEKTARNAGLEAWWQGAAERALREAGKEVPAWEALPVMRPRTRAGLEAAAARAGLKLERVRVDRDRLSERFAVDFMAMSPNWPKPGLGRRRAAIIARARALARGLGSARTARLRFRMGGGREP